MVMPSIPGAPLFALTLLYALLKLSLYSIASKSLGCALSLSFHIRLNLYKTKFVWTLEFAGFIQ